MASQRSPGGQPVALRDDAGRTVKLEDLICWRFLDGRPCITAAQRQLLGTTQVVLVPIPPPRRAGGDAGRGAKAAPAPAAALQQSRTCPALQQSCTCPAATPAGAAQPAAEAGGGGSACGPLLQLAQRLRGALAAAGVAAHLDDDARSTPGAKFHR
jgi:hypothetical protein